MIKHAVEKLKRTNPSSSVGRRIRPTLVFLLHRVLLNLLGGEPAYRPDLRRVSSIFIHLFNNFQAPTRPAADCRRARMANRSPAVTDGQPMSILVGPRPEFRTKPNSPCSHDFVNFAGPPPSPSANPGSAAFSNMAGNLPSGFLAKSTVNS